MTLNSTASAISPRARLIHRLLCASLAIAVLSLGVSLVVDFAAFSIYLTPANCGVTFIFTITLLVLTFKERKRATHAPAGLGTELADIGRAGSTNPSKPLLPIPHTLRKPTIIVAFLLALSWLITFGFLVAFVAISHWGDFGYDQAHPPSKVAPPAVEAALIGIQIGVVITFAAMAIKERRRFINAEGKWKWYQLGTYQA